MFPCPLCSGKGRVLSPPGLPLVPPQSLTCRDLLSFASGFLLEFSLGPVQLSGRTPLPWPLKKLQFGSIYHLPEYGKKKLAQVSSQLSSCTSCSSQGLKLKLYYLDLLFFPFKLLIIACREVVCLFILLIPDLDGSPWA